MPDRFPGYDVLTKRPGVSWNDKTREVVDARLALPPEPQFLDPDEFGLLKALADLIVPDPPGRPHVPAARLVDSQLKADQGDGYRRPNMPPLREAWRRGLAALQAEALEEHGAPFQHLARALQHDLLTRMQHGSLKNPAWGDMPPALFFESRLARDLIHAYYAYPDAWSFIGFGGPASPRGYVRMGFNERDPWEAAEASPASGLGAPAAERKNRRVR